MALSIRNLDISYPGRLVFIDVSLEIADNELVTVFTKVLDGGTSLLRGIAGFLRGVDGDVFLGEFDLLAASPSERAMRVGYVWESEGLISLYSVRQNIILPLLFHCDLSRDEVEARLTQCMDELHLDRALLDCLPHELNDVQTRLVNLARALIVNPELLLIDELEGGMSAEYVRDTMATLRHRQATSPLIIVISTANRYVMETSDRVLRIENHSLVEQTW